MSDRLQIVFLAYNRMRASLHVKAMVLLSIHSKSLSASKACEASRMLEIRLSLMGEESELVAVPLLHTPLRDFYSDYERLQGQEDSTLNHPLIGQPGHL